MYHSRTLTKSPILNVMIEAAEKAGRSLIRDYNEIEKLQVAKKGPADFVSTADQRSEKIIHESLQKARPDFSFLMEESGTEENKDKDNVWVVDPLDGTTNFLHGVPGFCINIAHTEKGQVKHGVTYDPLRGDLFWAEQGQGAFLNGQALRVSSRGQISESLFLFDHHDPQKQRGEFFHGLWDIARDHTCIVRCLGSAALALAYVAAGKSEGYFMYDLKPWDVLPGILMVKEAGGIVSEIDGKSNPGTGASILATNANIYDDMRGTLAPIITG